MKTDPKHKAACISAHDIEALARQGVERAIAARGGITDLSVEQAGQVGGAVSFAFAYPLIYGGRFDTLLKAGGTQIPEVGGMDAYQQF